MKVILKAINIDDQIDEGKFRNYFTNTRIPFVAERKISDQVLPVLKPDLRIEFYIGFKYIFYCKDIYYLFGEDTIKVTGFILSTPLAHALSLQQIEVLEQKDGWVFASKGDIIHV